MIAPTKAEEKRSTHFLAIRVTDPKLVANLCRVQDTIAAKEPNLHDCCIKPGLFHITIDPLRLEGPERVLGAMMERLRPVVEEMFQDQASAILEIDGLGNFEQRVVYAKVIHRLLFFSQFNSCKEAVSADAPLVIALQSFQHRVPHGEVLTPPKDAHPSRPTAATFYLYR